MTVLKMLCFLAFFSVANVQANTVYPGFVVSGRIIDEDNHPVSGVSIIEKGTSNGTLAKDDGTFSIKVKDGNAVLSVSRLGYTAQDVPIENNSSLTIVLKQSVADLNDIVVVGYGTQKKATLTGSVVSVNGDDIVKTKNENLLNTLAGKLPGVVIVQNSSMPGSYDNTFNIRGLGNALIVIDDIPQPDGSAFNRLNPNDIESVSVLKDASAAIYGVRAANGVVLVTTKKGKAGKFQFEYLGTYTTERQSGVPSMLNAPQYMEMRNEFLRSSNGLIPTSYYTQEEIQSYQSGQQKGTDWIGAVMLQNVPQTQHTISASGGSDKIKFYTSLNYLYQDGLFKNNSINYNKYQFVSNITATLTKALKATFNLSAYSDIQEQPHNTGNFFSLAWNTNPLEPIFWTGTTEYPTQNWLDIGLNPYIMMNPDIVGQDINTGKYFNGTASLSYDAPFLKGLNITLTGNYNFRQNLNKVFQKQYNLYTDSTPSALAAPVVHSSPSYINRAYYEYPTWTTRLQASYKTTIARQHNVSVTVLTEQSERKADNFFAQRDLVLPVPYLFAGLANGDQQGSMGTDYLWDYVNKAVAGRLTYDYKTKYLAEFGFRYDGSSKFINNHQWGFFPSGSVGWRINEEKFFKNASFLSAVDNLKLRASYGILGDDGAAAYQYLTGYNYPASGGNAINIPSGDVFDGNFIPSSQNRGIANPNLTWYTSKTFDAGIDYDMWQGKLGITVDYYIRNRSGLLATVAGALPGIVGASLPQQNLNSDQTHGFELALSHKSTIGKVNLSAGLNMSYTRTYWKTRGDQTPQTNSYNNWRNNRSDRVADVTFLLQGVGQYQSYQQIINSPWYKGNAIPGEYYYYDLSGGGQQNSSSYTYSYAPFLINANGAFPLMNFGGNLSAQYKEFDLSVVLQAATLWWKQIPQDFTRFSIGTNYGNGIDAFWDRWHPVDPNANPYDPATVWVPGVYSYGASATIATNSTFAFDNATYIRLKSIELGYSLSNALLKKLKIESARFFINGYNLLTWSKMPEYMDPEHPGATGEASGYAYPLNKTISLGVDIKF